VAPVPEDVQPQADRPRFHPSYEVPSDTDGLLPWSWATERLVAARNYWLSTTRPDGRPHAMPIWGIWDDGALWYFTTRDSAKGRNVAHQPEVVLHLESGDEVVVVEGRCERVDDAALERRLDDLFEPKYGWRHDRDRPEIRAVQSLYAVRPRVAYAWLERDFLRTATRFRF
jgi:PPOX class probable F420-dependent enzyme